MNDLEIFKNEELGLKVRTIVGEDGSISINAEDTAIGFGWSRTEIKKGKSYTSIRWATLNQYCSELGFANELAKEDYIPEALFYRLAMKAGNERADKFQNWLACDVLPTIRQTGGYVQEDREEEFINKYFPSFADDTKLTMIHDLRNQNKKFKKQLEEQRPLVDFANQVSNTTDLIDMGRMAKLLKDEHIDIGRNRLFEWLRKQEILMKNNIPYQRFIDGEFFKIKESVSETAYGPKTYTTTYVTGKGQIYITEKLRKEFESS